MEYANMKGRHVFYPTAVDSLEGRLLLSAAKPATLVAPRGGTTRGGPTGEHEAVRVRKPVAPWAAALALHRRGRVQANPAAAAVKRNLPADPARAAAPAPAPAVGRTAKATPVALSTSGSVDSMGDRVFTLKYGGLTRRYLVHTPAGYDGSSPLPVVLAFHGGGGNAEAQRSASGLNAVADQNQFMVVYPDGTGLTKYLYWNAGVEAVTATRKNVDDVGFVRALLDRLPNDFSIDARRVYATGMSNGAMLAYRLAAELPTRIAAIAPVAGGMSLGNARPARPVPVIHFHGVKDPIAPFLGGTGSILGVQHPSIPGVMSEWARANNAAPSPADVFTTAEFVRTRYAPAPGSAGAPVVLYALTEGGHTWPGGANLTAGLGTGKLVMSVSASNIMWDFFKQFSL